MSLLRKMPNYHLPGFTSSFCKECGSDSSPSSSFLAWTTAVHLRILGTGPWGLQGLLRLHVPRCMRRPLIAAAHDTRGRAAACLFLANFSSMLSYMGENNCLHSELWHSHIQAPALPLFFNRKTISATLGVSFTADLLIRETYFRRDSWGLWM